MARPRRLGLSADALLEGLGDAMFMVDPFGSIVHANSAAAGLTGYTVPELLTMSIEELVPGRLRPTHEAHREDFRARNSPARPMGPGLDLRLLHRDGHEVAVDISLSPIAEEGGLVLAVARDVTERRDAELRAREQADLLELAHDCILVRHAADSAIAFWNQGAVSTYGYSRREALGHVSHDLLGTVFPASREAVDRRLASHGRWEGELVHRRKDGRTIRVASRQVVVRDATGVARSILEINRDVTEERREHNRLEAALALAESLLAGDSLEAVLAAGAGRLRSLVAADWAVFATAEEDALSIRLADGPRVASLAGLRTDTPAQRLEGLLRSGRPELLADHRWRENGSSVPPEAEGSALVVQVTTREQRTGLLALGRTSESAEFTPSDLTTTQFMASVFALAVDHTRLRESAQRVSLLEDRERFAQEIQHGVVRSLFSIGLHLQATATMAADDRVGARVEEAMSAVDEAVRDLRAALFPVGGSSEPG